MNRDNDPDETEGRKLASGRADKYAHALNSIADKVLAYRPKPKSAPAKARKRKAKKAQRESKV